MKIIFLLLFAIVNLFANIEYYTKEIIFEKITMPTLVRVKIDDELYSKMLSNDIRVYSSNSRVENHYIKSNPPILQPSFSDEGYDIVTIPLLSKSIDLNYTDYIFQVDGIPSDRIIPNIMEEEYDRVVSIFVGNSQGKWHFILKDRLKKIKFSEQEEKEIVLNSSTKFIKLRVDNSSESLLTINSLMIKTAPNYLYFMAKPNLRYNIFFTKEYSENIDKDLIKLVDSNKLFIEGRLADLKRKEIIESKKENSEKSRDKRIVIAIVIAVVILFSIVLGLIKGKSE